MSEAPFIGPDTSPPEPSERGHCNVSGPEGKQELLLVRTESWLECGMRGIVILAALLKGTPLFHPFDSRTD